MLQLKCNPYLDKETMIKRFISLLIFIATQLILYGSPIPFTPLIKNYSVHDYNGGTQNWAIAQDKQGIMYFGNNKGLLEFDGLQWRLNELPQKRVIRSLYIDSERIYVGSYEEFGYFERTEYNTLRYYSLSSLLLDFSFHNDEIWNIFQVDDKIIFHSFGTLFIYDGNEVTYISIDPSQLNFFAINDTIYSQQINGGLYTWKNQKFYKSDITRLQTGNSDVIQGFSHQDGILLFTREQGVFLKKGAKVKEWPNSCNEQFKKHVINKVVKTKEGHYIVGTISGGIYALSLEGDLLWQADTQKGMLNNTVLNLFCDAYGNVWSVLDEGITYIHNNSTISCYSPPHENIGMIYDILSEGDKMYIASNQGLYCLIDDRIMPIPGLEEQAWYIKKRGSQIFCGHNKGTFLIEDLLFSKQGSHTGSMCLAEFKLMGTSYLLEGTYNNLVLYKLHADGRYRLVSLLEGFQHMIRKIEVDHLGNIWAKHWQKGIYHLRISDDLHCIKEIKNYQELGNNKTSFTSLFKVNGRVVFSDGLMFYTYEDLNDSIVPYDAMNQQLPELKNIHFCAPCQGNRHWFLNDHTAYLVKCEMNKFLVVKSVPYSLLGGKSIEYNESVIYNETEKSSYLCLNNMIVRIDADENGVKQSVYEPRLTVSQVTAKDVKNDDSFALPVYTNDRIESIYNSISFTLSYPVFDNYSYKLRYFLDGFSSKWMEGEGQVLQKEFLGLPYGEYTFLAEAYDVNGVLSRIEYPFTVLRPWYISYWAISCYILSGIVIIITSFYLAILYGRRKHRQMLDQERILHQAEMEKREKRIIELEKQQLQADLKNKSKELSEVMMTSIAHQEFLRSLKDEILQQRGAGQYNKKNLDKLLSLVNNNIVSDEENWTVFQANFDRIHENFFRNLVTQYPELTSSDLRFCALLRLNMPSKEIARFLNISIRGVDAARYRLRKKFRLSQEESLTTFIVNIK